MNLVSAIGVRERLTYKEVQAALGMTYNQIRNLAARGTIRRRFTGQYPFYFEDVNRFVLDFNSGKIHLGRGRRRKATKGKEEPKTETQ